MKGQNVHWAAGIALLALMATLPRTVLATAYTTGASGNWSDDASWLGTGIPDDGGDTATISASRTITVDMSPTIGGLTLSGSSWNLANGASANTLTTSALSISQEGTVGTTVTIALTGSGSNTQIGDGVYLNGTLAIRNGATLTATGMRYRGSGAFNVEAGGTFSLNGGFGINYNDNATGMTFDNDGVVKFNSTGTFYHYARNITGDGEWQMGNTGTLQMGGAATVFALSPGTATWTGNAGLLNFNQASTTGTHTLGGFSMGGNNTVKLDRGASYQINRASTFQNLTLGDSFGTTLDFAPAGGGAKTHTINGTLSMSGNGGAKFAAGAGAGATTAVLNVMGWNLANSNEPQIGPYVTVNLTGPSHTFSGAWLNITGALNVKSGARLTQTSANKLKGAGAFTVEAGGTYEMRSNGYINQYDGGASGMAVTNNGLVVVTNGTSTFTIYAKSVAGTGTWKVLNSGSSGGITFGNNTSVDGWNGSTALAGSAIWHVIGAGRKIDLPGGNLNTITSLGSQTTVILENGGVIPELNNSARNALTVNGKLHVRGTSDLQFNNGQSLTVASGGLLGCGGTVTVAGSGKVNVQSGGTLATEINGATATKLTVSGGNLTVSGFVNVSYASPPSATEYRIATATAITCTATTTGEAGWKPEVRGTELWIVKQALGTAILVR